MDHLHVFEEPMQAYHKLSKKYNTSRGKWAGKN